MLILNQIILRIRTDSLSGATPSYPFHSPSIFAKHMNTNFLNIIDSFLAIVDHNKSRPDLLVVVSIVNFEIKPLIKPNRIRIAGKL